MSSIAVVPSTLVEGNSASPGLTIVEGYETVDPRAGLRLQNRSDDIKDVDGNPRRFGVEYPQYVVTELVWNEGQNRLIRACTGSIDLGEPNDPREAGNYKFVDYKDPNGATIARIYVLPTGVEDLVVLEDEFGFNYAIDVSADGNFRALTEKEAEVALAMSPNLPKELELTPEQVARRGYFGTINPDPSALPPEKLAVYYYLSTGVAKTVAEARAFVAKEPRKANNGRPAGSPQETPNAEALRHAEVLRKAGYQRHPLRGSFSGSGAQYGLDVQVALDYFTTNPQVPRV